MNSPSITRRRSIFPSCLILTSIVFLLSGCRKDEADNDNTRPGSTDSLTAAARPDPVTSGHGTFLTYCASCHGSSGKGDGPVASVLTVKPADLTQLKIKYRNVYPVDSIYAYIDGRSYVQAHGTRQMPVWGNVWSQEAGNVVNEEEIDRRMRELVEYIRTIQVDETPAKS